ncbi:MAG TPA: hypothetical protein VFV69_19805, partial [Steroidobacteraceae bacterium]|nr:hypothetical protein [Steroidobacteraceae bacterium]
SSSGSSSVAVSVSVSGAGWASTSGVVVDGVVSSVDGEVSSGGSGGSSATAGGAVVVVVGELQAPAAGANSTTVTINSAAVIPASEAKEPPDKATRELAERLTGKKDPLKTDPFPAQWKTVELSRDRRLDLAPGDCELMEGLSKDVLPKLSIKIVSDRVLCTPNNLSITTPELTVSALVPLPKADESSSADRR